MLARPSARLRIRKRLGIPAQRGGPDVPPSAGRRRIDAGASGRPRPAVGLGQESRRWDADRRNTVSRLRRRLASERPGARGPFVEDLPQDGRRLPTAAKRHALAYGGKTGHRVHGPAPAGGSPEPRRRRSPPPTDKPPAGARSRGHRRRQRGTARSCRARRQTGIVRSAPPQPADGPSRPQRSARPDADRAPIARTPTPVRPTFSRAAKPTNAAADATSRTKWRWSSRLPRNPGGGRDRHALTRAPGARRRTSPDARAGSVGAPVAARTPPWRWRRPSPAAQPRPPAACGPYRCTWTGCAA